MQRRKKLHRGKTHSFQEQQPQLLLQATPNMQIQVRSPSDLHKFRSGFESVITVPAQTTYWIAMKWLCLLTPPSWGVSNRFHYFLLFILVTSYGSSSQSVVMKMII